MAAAISWINYVTPGLGVSITGTATNTVDPAYPLDNVLDPDLSSVARINTVQGGSTSTQTIRVDLGQDRTVRVVAALNVPIDDASVLDLPGMIFVRVLDSSATMIAFGSQLGASTLIPVPNTEDDPRYNLFWLLSSDVSNARYVELAVAVPSSQTINWGCGHLWAGPAVVLLKGIDASWAHRAVDGSPVARSPGGGFASRQLPTRSRLIASVGALPAALAVGDQSDAMTPSFRRIAREAGRSAPVVVIPRDNDAQVLQTMSIYGLFAEPPSYQRLPGDHFDAAFEVEEIR